MIKNLLKSKIGQFRIIAFFEGITVLFLVFVAMPMKYYLNMPEGSRIVGPIHGVLFITYVFYGFTCSQIYKWKFIKETLVVFIASFIPFGTFIVDHKILKKYDTENL
jgi:integral membrane protein